jgi:DNA-binding NarL/FixJ family response regulator
MTWNATKKNPWNLTDRQLAAMAAVNEKCMDKEAARHLGISYRTIAIHLAAARAKMGATNRLAAALMFDRQMRDKG